MGSFVNSSNNSFGGDAHDKGDSWPSKDVAVCGT